MRHSIAARAACRPHTWAACLLALVLLFVTGTPLRLESQVSFGVGASLQKVSHRAWGYRFFGSAVDVAVRTSPSTNFTFGVQALGHDEGTEVDPLHLRTAEIGMQWVAGRGELLHLAIGFHAGAYLLSEYDATYGGPILSLTARLSLHPVRGVGLFVSPLGRAFGGERGGSTYGVSFGVLLGTNH